MVSPQIPELSFFKKIIGTDSPQKHDHLLHKIMGTASPQNHGENQDHIFSKNNQTG